MGAATFYAVFSLCGILGLVLVRTFTSVNIKTYFIAKPLGLLLFGWACWLLSSARILPFGNSALVATLFFASVACSAYAVFFSSRGRAEVTITKKSIRSFILLELASLALYFGYLYIRSFNPAINGTEKFMDMALMASSGKANFFPFADFWQSSLSVNYYYFGSFLMALLSKLSGVAYAYGYNYSLGMLLASTFSVVAILVHDITKSKFFSMFGAFMVAFGGNLYYTACVATHWGSNLVQACYYPTATRLLDPSYNIYEYPAYSFVLGDLHPHFISLPFLVLGLWMLWLLYQSEKPRSWLVAATALVLASNAVINPPNFATLGALFAVIFFIKMYAAHTARVRWQWVVTGAILAACPWILYLPFFLSFKSFVAGIGWAPAYAAAHHLAGATGQYPSSAWILVGMWGIFLAVTLGSLVLLKFAFKEKIWREHGFAISMLIIAIGLIVFAELFFYEDLFHVFNAPYFRSNTVFKSTYQAWAILSVCAAVLWAALTSAMKKIQTRGLRLTAQTLNAIAIGAVIAVSLVFPYEAYVQAYNVQLPWDAHVKLSLNGAAFIQQQSPGDYATISWINANVLQRVVILEAAGNDYTYHGRIGVFTGNSNPINWSDHELTWRFRYPPGVSNWREAAEDPNGDYGYSEIASVVADVQTLYNSQDVAATRALLAKYGIQYVYIGDQERQDYPNLDEAKFYQLGTVAFASGNSVLFKIN